MEILGDIFQRSLRFCLERLESLLDSGWRLLILEEQYLDGSCPGFATTEQTQTIQNPN